MKKLLELEAKLRKAKEELEKQSILGSMNPTTTYTGMPAGTAGVNVVKEEHCSEEDEKADKKMIEDKMDEHNEKKHGEAKDTDSAKKSDVTKGYNEMVKFEKNGQWSITKATIADMKPNGEFDVPVKEVYDGDDDFVHVGNRGVDGDDKGKVDKLSDKEKELLKD